MSISEYYYLLIIRTSGDSNDTKFELDSFEDITKHNTETEMIDRLRLGSDYDGDHDAQAVATLLTKFQFRARLNSAELWGLKTSFPLDWKSGMALPNSMCDLIREKGVKF